MNFRQGIKLSLATAVFSGFAIFLNGFVVKAVGDALVFTTLKNLGVAVVIGLVLAIKTSRGQVEWRSVRRNDWLRLFAIGVIGGSLPFYLFFKGLTLAESAQAALIHKTLVFWVALAAAPVLKERLTTRQLGALALVFGSNLAIGGIGQFRWGAGETMILAATILWAIENVIAKIALKTVAADVVVGGRMILGSLLLLAATLVSGKMGLVANLTLAQWGLTLLTVMLLTGYVLTWYRALRLAPATLVATVLTLGAVVTNVLSAVFITHALSFEILAQTVLLSAGVWFFTLTVRRMSASTTWEVEPNPR